MTTAVASDAVFASRTRVSAPAIAPALAVAAFASLGAGSVHAAAVGAHSEHRQAVVTFTIVALAQLGWGVVALMRPGRVMAALGAVINGAAIAGWVAAKTQSDGISFVDGLDRKEAVQFADGLAATFAGIAIVCGVLAVFWYAMRTWFGSVAFFGTALVTAVVTMFGMVSAGSHAHADDHGGGATGTARHDHGGAPMPEQAGPGHDDHGAAAVIPPKPYHPDKPIDLSGVPGVSEKEQAEAENLIAITLLRLPKYADYRVAERDGYVSIGDGVTGTEHFVKLSYFDDEHIMNPDFPESLVYDVDRATGTRTLAAAMYMLNTGKTLDDVPKLGGKLIQWHIHDNLCFNSQARIAGIAPPDQPCPEGTARGGLNPMVHVWIRPHPCGPFAALEGIGGGTIKEGETRLCDHAHGA
jgi:hypothetical protein